jgi:hypothetical protein
MRAKTLNISDILHSRSEYRIKRLSRGLSGSRSGQVVTTRLLRALTREGDSDHCRSKIKTPLFQLFFIDGRERSAPANYPINRESGLALIADD